MYLKAVIFWLLACSLALVASAQSAAPMNLPTLTVSAKFHGLTDAFPVPGANLTYSSLTTSSAMEEAPVQVLDSVSALETIQNDKLWRGVVVGMLLAMIAYNVFGVISTREASHGFYMALIASNLLLYLSLPNHTSTSGWPTGMHGNRTLTATLTASSTLFSCLFINSFFRLKQFSKPAWLWVVVLTAASTLLLVLTLTLPHHLSQPLSTALSFIVVSTALGVGYWRWWRGAQFARFFCLAWTSMLIGVTVLSVTQYGLTPSITWASDAQQLSLILLGLLLSFALTDRINHDRSLEAKTQVAALAHERAARASQEALLRTKEEANRLLEQRVKARTGELNSTLDQLQLANDRLLLLSTTDTLTQINNRTFFDNALSTEHRRARRLKSPLALVMFDLDHFKLTNDLHGHLAGDACLQALGRLMRPWVHRAGDVLARYSGDVFVILLIGSNLESTMTLAERFRTEIERFSIEFEGTVIRLSASFGVVSGTPHQDNSPQELLSQADKALQLAKDSGRNCVRSMTLEAVDLSTMPN